MPAANPKRVAILAAEPSGDLQGAAVALQLQRRVPDLEIVGVGGRHMRQAGAKLLFDTSTLSVVGPAESIPRLPAMYWRYLQMRHELLRLRPDLTVLIDAPGVHMRLANYTREHGLRSLYYFPPSAWTKNSERCRQVWERVDGVLAPFEYTARMYRQAGLPVAHFGHPLVDLIPTLETAEAQCRLGLEAGDYLALLPGSRTQEVRMTLPILLEAARLLRELRPNLRFLLPCASVPIESRIRNRVGECPPWLRIISGNSREVLAASRIALVTSGSATLEAALLGIPTVVFYRVNWADYALGWTLHHTRIYRVGRFGLPNLVLDEDIVPEFLQMEANPIRLVEQSLELLEEGPSRSRMLAGLARVRQALGSTGAVERIGAFVHHFASGLGVQEAIAAVEREYRSAA